MLQQPPCKTVPLAILSNDISESSEEDENSPLMEDDITTRGLGRLSSAATCLVAGVEYTHGQQIYRADQCEFCLCLDGEMFCWWQDCPPPLEGPCKSQEPFSACTSIPVAATSKPKITPLQPPTTTANPTTKKLNNPKKSSSSTTIQTTTTQWPTDTHESSSIHSDSYSISSTEENGSSDIQLSTESESTTEDAKSCIVMGEEYKVGDSLPHSTGNCLECICGQGGKITCSPHQCEPAGDEINDYRQPDSRQGNDGFK
ncbi:uncharacterized protein LOC109539003 isoform X1 [Dendroctonus ponderosae]|uniref:uncharacterized protein LOC109539003 isoform X1 n=2 Tax=Dendroctonus ponderosae TaxID=77166 RepID=UPI0020363263|nr:uncharacterized protein LOC109539003 isoform X1 [Dendroctonus ponderosae]